MFIPKKYKRNKAVLAFLICFRPLKKVTEVFFSGRGIEDLSAQLTRIRCSINGKKNVYIDVSSMRKKLSFVRKKLIL
ncbi:hypothetical protein BpHYR1_016185 [Brachionus plicatilis]|uniref:Uncharacterized protein n=1 Tax=Brachionus plicatilis TaxID=10195 RepID=A0A3M7R3S5_BRAPC|nr:hypothetical protein BpHYR1_016185 [Brachionus plicatilis]